jgi:hypothetical protein
VATAFRIAPPSLPLPQEHVLDEERRHHMMRLALVALLAVAGCGSECTAGSMRCNGTTAEICKTDGSAWQTFQDCATSSFGGACFADAAHCAVSGEPACCL